MPRRLADKQQGEMNQQDIPQCNVYFGLGGSYEARALFSQKWKDWCNSLHQEIMHQLALFPSCIKWREFGVEILCECDVAQFDLLFVLSLCCSCSATLVVLIICFPKCRSRGNYSRTRFWKGKKCKHLNERSDSLFSESSAKDTKDGKMFLDCQRWERIKGKNTLEHL